MKIKGDRIRSFQRLFAIILIISIILSSNDLQVYALEISEGNRTEYFETEIDTEEFSETDSLQTEIIQTESFETEIANKQDTEWNIGTTEIEEMEDETNNSDVTEEIERETSETNDSNVIEEMEKETIDITVIESDIDDSDETITDIKEINSFENATSETVKDTEMESFDIEMEREKIRKELNHNIVATTGYIADEMVAEVLKQKETAFLETERSVLPIRYSAIENNQITSIKNQGNWGACWAFAPIAVAESFYKQMAGEESNLSETHLINFFYNEDLKGPDSGLAGDKVIPFRDKVDNGGNSMYTTFALARWTGIADEQTDNSLVYPSVEVTEKTKELNIPQEYAYTDLVHLQNAYWINRSNTDSIKEAIMKYGSIVVSYKHDESCSSNSVDKSVYSGSTVYYNDQDYGTSHALAIVGWDDDFDKNNFKYTALNQKDIFIEAGISYIPKNNGAWLVKNSWGTEYGDNGYFWMSYEEASLADTMFAYEFENADNYDHIYQYDGSVGIRYESDNVITAAAVYQSTSNQMIEAVGVGVASAETDYIVEIYTNLKERDNPQSGMLSSKTTGTTTFQGYYTIKLDEYVSIAKGDLFSVVITLSNGVVDGENGAAIFMDQSYQNGNAVKFVAHTNPNETFLKTENGWQDAVDRGTYRIKAYTSDSEFDVPQENRLLTPEMVKEIEDQEYNGTQNEPDIEISYMGEPLIKDIDFNVTYSNNSKAADKTESDAPKALITGIGKYTGTVEQAFTITKKSLEDEMLESVETTYNGTIQDDLTLKNGEILLVKGNDYQIAFNKQPYNAGNYTATVTGINNYTGELIVPYTITKTTIVEDAIIVPEQVVYTGTANKVPIQVTVNGAELPASNYSVSYKNNTNVGTATVMITGKGNCQGKVTKTFAILPKSIEAEDFTMTVADKIYSGKELLPSVSVKWGKKTLKKGKDYTIVYANNILAAEKAETDAPKVIVTGVGNYQGTREIGFTIMPKEIAESSISAQISYCESKENSMQTDSDTMPAQIENSMQTDSDTMDRLTENNLRTDSDTMAVQIENDLQTDSDTMAVQIENSLQTDNHVKDRQTENSGSNIRVLIGKTELNTNQYDMVVYNAGTTHIVEQSQLVLGTKYDIQITLKGNYRVKGKTSALKKNIICKRDISNLDILLKESNAVYTYNAKAQKPQIIVKDENGIVVSKTQYTISYADNIHAGTAGIIVTGKGDYAGTKRIPFTIQKQ